MSDNHLTSVLGLLRLLKKTEGLGANNSATQYIQSWAESAADDETVLRVAVYIQSQLAGAEGLIAQSDFVDEGKVGLLQTITGLRTAFSLNGIQTAIGSHLPALESSIAQFAILNSILGPAPNLAESHELSRLISDVERLHNSLSQADLDPVVKVTLVKHLHVLAMLLKNLEVMGVEAAMSAYAELVIRLRAAESKAPKESQAQVKKLWPKIEALAGRIGALQKLFDAGAAIASYGKPLLALIKGE